MANREQPATNNAEEMRTPAKPPETEGEEKPTPKPPESEGVPHVLPRSPESSRSRPTAKPSDSSGAALPDQNRIPERPTESSWEQQSTSQQPRKSSVTEKESPKQVGPPENKDGPREEKPKSKKNKKQKQAVSTEKQSTTSPKQKQPSKKPGQAKLKLPPEETLQDSEQAASTSKEIQVGKQQNGKEDAKRSMNHTEKKMSQTQSETGQSAAPPQDKDATNKLDTGEEPAPLLELLEVDGWSSILQDEAPVAVAAGEHTKAVSKGEQIAMSAATNKQQRPTEAKPSSGPKRKNGKKRQAMRDPGAQSIPQPAQKQSKVSVEVRKETTSAEPRQTDEQSVTSLSQKLSKVTVRQREKEGSAVGGEFNDPTVTSQPTSGEVEQLFWQVLAEGFPRHFSTEMVQAIRRNGRLLIHNAHVLVIGCLEGTTYVDLFGSLTKENVYKAGPIMKAIDKMVPFLKKRNINAIKKAREYLNESYMVRRGELQERSPSYQTHLYMVRVVEGTLSYLTELVEWLSQSDADPWIPLGQRCDATD